MKNERVNNTNVSTDNLSGVIASTRSLIDQIDLNFTELKHLILELARRLDEESIVKQGHVCRKIKEILKDKINQGKISEKWIEECLPPEYKRKYTKSELSSLSQQEVAEKELSNPPLIRVDNVGEEVAEDKGSEDASPSNQTWKTNNEGYILLIENSELKIHGSQLVYMIHREKYQELSNSMEKSADFIRIIFDQLGPFIRAEPDVLRQR